MTKRIGFEALVQQVNVKSLRTGDKSMRITLEVDGPSDDLVAKINELHRPDRFVGVAIAEKKTR